MSKKEPTKKKGGYDVGYGKPPAQSQFKPGQSGNPKGRPKGQPSFDELMLREAAKLVRVKSNDGVQTMSKAQFVISRVYQAAATGDLRAASMVMSSLAKIPAESIEQQVGSVPFSIPDDEAVRRILARFQHLEPPGEDSE